MSATPKPTAEQIAKWRLEISFFDASFDAREIERCAHNLANSFEALLDAYEATQRPIVAEPEYPAPLDVAALPAFWHARRARAGKGPSLCAEELERALERNKQGLAQNEQDALEGARTWLKFRTRPSMSTKEAACQWIVMLAESLSVARSQLSATQARLAAAERERDEARRLHSVLHDVAAGGCMHTMLRHEHGCAVDAINRWRAKVPPPSGAQWGYECAMDERNEARAERDALKKLLGTYARNALLHALREISEDYECASWHLGLEYAVWQSVLSGNTIERYDAEERSLWNMNPDDIERLKTMSRDAGGWFAWDNGGPVFLDMADWLKVYADHQRAARKHLKEKPDAG